MIIAIDYDDTIHDTHNVPKGYKMGQPVEGAVDALWKLVYAGHELFILTASSDARRSSIIKWMEYFGFPALRVTSEKLKADAYIDDKGIRFTNWDTVLEELHEK